MKFFVEYKWPLLTIFMISGALIYWGIEDEDKVWVSIAAAHYFPPNHRIDEFYVDRLAYGNSGFDGDAGMGMCCVWLPKRWRPGMVVDVRWVVTDWTESPIEDKQHFDWEKVKLVGIYRAKVPVERYEEADDVFVHFFNGGKVRVAPGVRDFRDKKNLGNSIKRAEERAIVGQSVNEAFTAKEEAEILEERERWKERRRRWP